MGKTINRVNEKVAGSTARWTRQDGYPQGKTRSKPFGGDRLGDEFSRGGVKAWESGVDGWALENQVGHFWG